MLNCHKINRRSLHVSGTVRVNNHRIRCAEDIASMSAYVQQKDAFIGTLKVKEHLLFHVGHSFQLLIIRLVTVVHRLIDLV